MFSRSFTPELHVSSVNEAHLALIWHLVKGHAVLLNCFCPVLAFEMDVSNVDTHAPRHVELSIAHNGMQNAECLFVQACCMACVGQAHLYSKL